MEESEFCLSKSDSDLAEFNEDSKEHIVVEVGFDIPNEENLDVSEASLLEKNPFVACEKCCEDFLSIPSFKAHWRKQHREADISFKCPICCSIFDNPAQLRRHRYKAHLEVKQRCPVCDKIFGASYLWRSHVRTHDGNKPFSCTGCDKSFLSKAQLTKHSKTHIPIEDRLLYQCNICSQRFATSPGLDSHLYMHKGEKNFICEVCGNKFRTKGAVKSHQITHSDERPFNCPKCDKTFRSKAQLKIHDRLHTNMKPFVCDLCQKCFMRRDVWRKHLKMHANIRPYNCRFCDKAFRTKDKLQAHERIHTGERPFQCEVCPSAFYESGNLRKHMQKVHKQPSSSSLSLTQHEQSAVSHNDHSLLPMFAHTIFHAAITEDTGRSSSSAKFVI